MCPVFYPTLILLFCFQIFSEEMKNLELAVLQNLLGTQWTSRIILLGSQMTHWDHDKPFRDHNGLMELFYWDHSGPF